MNTYTHLKWMHQSTHVTGILHEFLNSNTFTDVTLVSDENIEYLAHRAVLSACSSTFKTIFKEHYQYDPVVYLTGCAYQEIESMLEYMYLG